MVSRPTEQAVDNRRRGELVMIDLAKARAIMDREEIDLLVVGTPENFYYTTGIYPHECDFIKDHIRYAVIPKGPTVQMAPQSVLPA